MGSPWKRSRQTLLFLVAGCLRPGRAFWAPLSLSQPRAEGWQGIGASHVHADAHFRQAKPFHPSGLAKNRSGNGMHVSAWLNANRCVPARKVRHLPGANCWR